MGQFGELLRRERESRGIALETISHSTKIVGRYLAALEQEKFELLPGGILSKGIVRGYVRAVGLDEATWMERFLAASRARGIVSGDENWMEFANRVAELRPRSRHAGHRLRWAAMLALLVLLAGLGFYIWRHVSDRVEAQEVHAHPVSAVSVAPSGP